MTWIQSGRWMMRHQRALGIALLLVLVPVTRTISEWAGRIRSGALTAVGQRHVMGEVTLEDAGDGSVWRLSEHRGQVVLINLWATWCGPCMEETPGLVRAARELGGERFALVGMSIDSGGGTAANREKVAAFARHFGVKHQLGFPAAGGTPMELEVISIPTSLLIDAEGRVAKRYPGPIGAETLEADVREVLKE